MSSTPTSHATPDHISGRGIDGGATASTDATHVQELVRRKMEAAKLERLRAEGKELPQDEARVGTRSDGSFGLLSEDVVKQHEEVGDEGQITKPMDQMDIKPVRGILKNKDAGGARKGSAGSDTLVGKEGNAEVSEEEVKKEPELKRRVSKMWKSAIVKIRGPAVARGL